MINMVLFLEIMWMGRGVVCGKGGGDIRSVRFRVIGGI